MSKIINSRVSEELITNLKDAELGYNYYNIRVRHADLAKEIEDIDGTSNVMLKSEYDTDNDGKVDNAAHADNADNATHADNADKLGNHPASYFATASHNHNLSDLADVDDTDKADGKILQWSDSANAHIYADKGSSSGGDMKKSTYDPDDDGKVENSDHADNADKLQNHPVSDFALLNEDNTFNGKQTVNGEIKHSYNGADPDNPPHQVTPLVIKFGTAGEYNIDGTGNIYHFSSYALNHGSRPVVGVFGFTEALGNNSQAWGGNFGAYARASGAHAHGVEINFGSLVDGGLAYGILVVSTGYYRTQRHISIHANSSSNAPLQGIWFARHESVSPVDPSGTLIGADSGISANIGIDLSGVTFGLTAIRLPNNENISGLTSNGSTRQILKISSDNYVHIGDASGYQGIAFYPGSTNNIIFTPSGDIHLPGKLTSDGGNDPAYVLYDYQTRESLIKRIKEEIPPSKLDGAVLFYNGDTEQLEVFIPKKGKFIDLTGKVLETVDPITETFEVEKEYFFDKNTGEIRCIEIKKRKKEYRLKDGYQVDKKTGKIIKVCPETKEILKTDVPKEEAIEEILLE